MDSNSSDTESDSVRTARSGSSQSMKELSILRLQRTTLYKERAREQLEALQVRNYLASCASYSLSRFNKKNFHRDCSGSTMLLLSILILSLQLIIYKSA